MFAKHLFPSQQASIKKTTSNTFEVIIDERRMGQNISTMCMSTTKDQK